MIGGEDIVNQQQTDYEEWLTLILEAKEMNITIEEIREFLNKNKDD